MAMPREYEQTLKAQVDEFGNPIPPAETDVLQPSAQDNLRAYLENIMRSKRGDEAGLAETQQSVAQGAAGLGYAQAGETIGRALAGAAPAQGSFDSYRDANKQRLNDYLARVKAGRDEQYDQLSAAKELVALQGAEEKAKAGKEYQVVEKGADGNYHKIVKKFDPMGNPLPAMDLGIATEFEAEQYNKSLDRAIRQQGMDRLDSAQATKEAKQASDSLLKYDITGQENSLSIVKSLMKIDPNTGEATIPGFAEGTYEQGKLKLRQVADKLEPDELKARTALQRLANQEIKSQSGAAVTNQEYRRFLEAIQGGSWFAFSPTQVANYVGMLEQEINKKKALISNVSPRGYEQATGGAANTPAPAETLNGKDGFVYEKSPKGWKKTNKKWK